VVSQEAVLVEQSVGSTVTVKAMQRHNDGNDDCYHHHHVHAHANDRQIATTTDCRCAHQHKSQTKNTSNNRQQSFAHAFLRSILYIVSFFQLVHQSISINHNVTNKRKETIRVIFSVELLKLEQNVQLSNTYKLMNE